MPITCRTTSCLVLLSVVVRAGILQAAHAPAKQPNLVMLFTDDQRWDAVGYAGNLAVHTPQLDQLARQGLVFEQCFVNTSICAVSRANLLTGQYPGRHGVNDFFRILSEDQLRHSVPGRLQAAGYQTAFIGKWGIGDSPDLTHRGAAVFDYWAGQPMQTCYYHQPQCRYVRFNGFQRPLDDLCDCPADSRGKIGYRNRIGLEGLHDPLHVDADIAPLHLERFLRGRDEQRPFCLMMFFKSPHSPFTDWSPAVAQVTDNLVMPVPAAATLVNAMREPELIRKSLGGPAGMRYLENPTVLDRHLRDYYRQIASMDLGVGRMLDLLDKYGVRDNTVILFTSDNGHFTGEHGLSGKWLMYEPSLRVPGFIYDPRRPGAKVSRRMIITTDFSVTLLTLAGLDVPTSMTGRDLMALYDQPSAGWRKDFLYDHPYGHRGKIPRTVGVRDERFVYTRYIDLDPPFEQLFDLWHDPNQLTNLAEQRDWQSQLGKMRARCDQLRQACQ